MKKVTFKEEKSDENSRLYLIFKSPQDETIIILKSNKFIGTISVERNRYSVLLYVTTSVLRMNQKFTSFSMYLGRD